MRNITVVIPVYKDWDSLDRCIKSLKEHLSSRHQVIIINDVGNEWKQMEDSILYSINGFHNYEYYKNEKNIGFIKSCNKAVLELADSENDILLLNSDTEVTEGFLEEMNEILNSDNTIGVVCPRSNKATFLSIPIHRNDNVAVTREQSYLIYSRIRQFLPRTEEIWTGVGFAFLVKREIINKFGLFDEIFGRGYNEENDFCMRIRQAGFKVMKANHAYVFHDEGKSFSDEKEELELRNSSVLLRRYPDYWDNVKRYEELISPIDYFSDLLVKDANLYRKQRVLICALKELTAEEIPETILTIKKIITSYADEIDFQLLVNKKNYRKFKRGFPELLIWTENTLTNTFHMIYSLYHLEQGNEILLYKYGIIIKVRDEKKQGEDILKDLADTNLLSDEWINSLYIRREYYTKLKRVKEKNPFYNLKKYIYMHHIWLFILWHKIRK